MTAPRLLSMPDGLIPVSFSPAPPPAISAADMARWSALTAEVRELREANPVPLASWERKRQTEPPVNVDSDAYSCLVCGHETVSDSLNAAGVCWRCEQSEAKIVRCRKCRALATDENPVEPESEECSACANDRGREFGPMPVVQREF